MNEKSSYAQIIKTTSLFGGVHILNIVISIVRSKMVAVFIGPAGMGVISLLTSAINIVNGFSGLGIETSAVQHISSKYKGNDISSVLVIIAVVKKLVMITGILGSILALCLSSLLSTITFGNTEHTSAFVYISITILLRQLTSGELAVLQGLRKVRLLAKANFFGNLMGLFFSLPVYYYLKIEAIIPTIIIVSISSLFFALFFSKSLEIEKSRIPFKEILIQSKSVLKLGVLLTISGLLTLLTTYIIQIYIGNSGGLEEVGYYIAGFTLLNSYVGIIFTVMSTDYFPRLSSIIDDENKIRNSVVQQSFISILIITPIVTLFLLFVPIIVKIIYTSKFEVIVPMVSIGILGMLFKSISWSMGFILIAKGDSKMFLFTSVIFNMLLLLMNVGGYYLYGLTGLGISFLGYYIIHFYALKIITNHRYNFYFKNEFYVVYASCILICIITFGLTYIENIILKNSLMSFMSVLSLIFVLHHLNKKIDLISFYDNIIKKKNG